MGLHTHGCIHQQAYSLAVRYVIHHCDIAVLYTAPHDPADSGGLQRTPADFAGLRRTPAESSMSQNVTNGVRRTPADSTGFWWILVDFSRVRRTPADSGGLQWTPADSSGLRQTPV